VGHPYTGCDYCGPVEGTQGSIGEPVQRNKGYSGILVAGRLRSVVSEGVWIRPSKDKKRLGGRVEQNSEKGIL
jgi:hypothetical protein